MWKLVTISVVQATSLVDTITDEFHYLENKAEDVYKQLIGPVNLGDQVTNRFGNIETIVRHEEGLVEKAVDFVENAVYHLDYRQQANHLESLTEYLRGDKHFKLPWEAPLTCFENRGYPSNSSMFAFAPEFSGQLRFDNPLSFKGECFEKIDMNMEKVSDTQIQVTVNTHKPRSLTCSEFFIFGNTEMLHIEDFFVRGKHVLNFNFKGANALNDLDLRGLETYMFCNSYKDEFLSIFTTIKAFVGGLGLHGKIPLYQPKVPKYMEMANKEFLRWAINWDL